MTIPTLKLLTLIGLGTALCGPAWSDQVFNDDVIVDGSLCAGTDCANGESFGFDTIRVKENNTRIGFTDTSTSASFPGNDWELRANDSSNGGSNYFAIVDVTGGKTPMTVEANAPSNTLFVAQEGRVGVGTSNPVVQMHLVDGNSPALRLEQDGSDGFTAQTWDIAANETNFFVRDVTNGSKLPFKIKPGAPDNAVFVAADGAVGIGTASPSSAIHVRRSDGTAQLRIEEASSTAAARTLLNMRNNGITTLAMTDTRSGGGSWGVQNRGTNNSNELWITNATGPGEEFRLSQTGNLIITGTITTGGTTCGGGCDLVFAKDYDLPSISEHTEQMYTLGYLPNVGPTIEGAPFDLTDKLGRMLNELEHAHIYIATQQEEIATLSARIKALEAN